MWFSSIACCVSSATQIGKKMDKLRQAESRLLEYALRHSLIKSESSTSTSINNISIKVFDTQILRTSVPLNNHDNDLSCLNNDDNNKQDYTIHCVHATSPSLPSLNKNDKQMMNNKTDTPLVLLHGYSK